MSMESTAWTQLQNVMNARPGHRPFARATLRRIAAFARPHRRSIILFVLLGVWGETGPRGCTHPAARADEEARGSGARG
ncbi:hypothetical protein ACFXP3_09815, partial [Streptomyces sp. NPDC059096]|uniref:hypothetical protein n=1 Tax=Streptomyces sp. NPDC059096 TaxID=3346727 RepID=UPI0036752067